MRLMFLLVPLNLAAYGQGFEVASVRVHSPATDQPVMKQPGVSPIRISGNRVELQAVTLKELVVAAYGVKEYQVSGGPGWASGIDSMFNVEAKAPGDATPTTDQVQKMLQAFLADRFRLNLRRESKQLPVYNLVVARGGPKLKPVSADAPLAPGMRRGDIGQIAALWSLYLDRPVIDRSGLTGLYDFPVRLWQLDTNVADAEDMATRALAALRDELGLRAEPARATLEMLVIENAEKPSQN